ncbi:MAG: hypothetical protein QM811_28430 [Pirellulales bacterium]
MFDSLHDAEHRDRATAACPPPRSGPAPIIKRAGPLVLPVVTKRSPFESLARAIANQQLNGTAARTILNRFRDLSPHERFPSPETVLALDPEVIRRCGFSYGKIAALRNLAAKTLDGTVPSARKLKTMADDDIVERLVTVRGIGRWTVEMLLIFQLGRTDVFPVDDFGVRNGYRILQGHDEMLKPAHCWRSANAGGPTARSRPGISGAPPTWRRTRSKWQAVRNWGLKRKVTSGTRGPAVHCALRLVELHATNIVTDHLPHHFSLAPTTSDGYLSSQRFPREETHLSGGVHDADDLPAEGPRRRELLCLFAACVSPRPIRSPIWFARPTR